MSRRILSNETVVLSCSRAVLIGLIVFNCCFADDDAPKVNARGQPADARVGKLTDQPPRYYVWHDAQGWHLRSASKEKNFVHFTGSIELTKGEFGQLRPIGLESKGKYADRWSVDANRKKLQFDIHTSGSFDGFDFTVAKDQTGEMQCDLNIGGKAMPKRIFVGKDSEHPRELPFSVPVAP
jgi:hypothetical protein